MKLIIELELDQEAYDAKYGPETEWWRQYRTEWDEATQMNYILPPEAYEFGPGKAEAALAEMAVDILHEGFSDWRTLRDDGSALKIAVNGKAACLCCGLTEGHEDYCDKPREG